MKHYNFLVGNEMKTVSGIALTVWTAFKRIKKQYPDQSVRLFGGRYEQIS